MGVTVISILELYSCVDESPVISLLDHGSGLNVTPSHLTPGPLFAHGCEFLSSLTWTTVTS